MIHSVLSSPSMLSRSLSAAAIILASAGVTVLLAQNGPGIRARVGYVPSSGTTIGHVNAKIRTPENTFDHRLSRLADAAPVSGRGAEVVVGLVPSARMRPDTPTRSHSVAKQVAGGIVGGAIGTVVGVALFAVSLESASQDCRQDFGCSAGMALEGLLVTVAGETAGLACGVHIANGRQGDMRLDLAVSGLILGAGIAVALKTEEPRVLFAVPVAQLVGVIAAERASAATGNRRDVSWCP